MNLSWIEMHEEQFARKNYSKMLRESLWKDGGGCQCQNIFVINIEDGKLLKYDQQSEYPVHIKTKIEDNIKQTLIKVESNQPKEEKGMINFSELDNYVDINGEPRLATPCYDFSENNWEDDVTDEKLPNGIYLIMLQTHCWSEIPWGHSYPEGNSEYEVVFVTSVPIDFTGFFNGEIQRRESMEGEK